MEFNDLLVLCQLILLDCTFLECVSVEFSALLANRETTDLNADMAETLSPFVQ